MNPFKTLLLSSVFLLSPTGSLVAEVITLDEAKGPIRVDGHLEDWPPARMFLFDKVSQVTYGRAYWKGPEDLSGSVFLTYDDRYLYLAAVVRKKDRVVNDQDLPSLWDGDGIELFFSTRAGENKDRGAGDFHLGFTPGTDCKDPRMYCFNKDKEIQGGRIIARVTQEGYLLEVGVPLDFFSGLDLQQGKLAGLDLSLDGGGFRGQRVMRFDLTGRPGDDGWPDHWAQVRWIGTKAISVPEAGLPAFSPGLLQDGTKGSTFGGTRSIKGRVTDATGNPLSGARITTWPRTTQAVSDDSGSFELKGIKVYDKTVIYANATGYGTSLFPLPPGASSVQVQCWPLPQRSPSVQGTPGPNIFGETFPDPGQTGILASPDRSETPPRGYLRLTGKEGTEDRVGWLKGWDELLAYANANGYTPLVEVPMDPVRASDLVRHINLEGKAGVRYWIFGKAVDRGIRAMDPSGKGTLAALINGYRSCFNAMKRVDPSIFLLGPELDEKYRGMDEDWLTPFLAFNGDILDIVSIHRFGVRKGGDLSERSLEDSLRRERSLLRSLKGRSAESAGRNVPLAVTAAWACSEPSTSSGTDGFLGLLWMAEQGAMAYQEGLVLDLCAPGRGGQDLSGQVRSLLAVLSGLRGSPLEGRMTSKLPALSFYACQDPKTKDVTVLLVNREDRFRRIRVRLDGKGGDLRIEAGLDEEFDYEAQSHSVSLLTLKADKSQGKMTFFTKAMAAKGLGPSSYGLKTW